jgi:phosphate uptake regulator
LTVSLPKEWTDLVGIKPGDSVYLERGRNGTLTIQSGKSVEKENQEYRIDCDRVGEPNFLERLIVGGYLKGAYTIKISSSTRINGEQIEEIRTIARRLIGLSIVEMSRNEITLQVFIDPLKFEIYPLIQKLSLVSSTMLNESMEALFKLDAELANEVIDMENETNNIFWLIRRLLLASLESHATAEKLGLNEPLDATDIRLVSKNLETIGDCSVRIAKIALDLHQMTHEARIRTEMNEKELEEIPALDQLVREVVSKSLESLFSRNLLAANKAINLREKLDARVEAFMHTAKIPYFPAIAIMLGIVAENCASIASVAFDLEIKKADTFPSL